jgi:hypothetical protein
VWLVLPVSTLSFQLSKSFGLCWFEALRPVSLLPNLQLHRRSTPAIAPLENPLNRRKPTAIHIILVGWIAGETYSPGSTLRLWTWEATGA